MGFLSGIRSLSTALALSVILAAIANAGGVGASYDVGVSHDGDGVRVKGEVFLESLVDVRVGYNDGLVGNLYLPLHKSVGMGVGYESMSIGPGEFFNPMLSEDSKLYPVVWLDGTLKGIKWKEFHAPLGSDDPKAPGGPSRTLFGHTLEATVGRLTLGVAETGIVKGDISPGIYVPVPFIPLQIRQFVFERASQDINLHADVNASYDLGKGSVYGEYYVDHIAGYPWQRATYPEATGWVAGVRSTAGSVLGPIVALEYARNKAYTYTHRETGHYQHQGTPLGGPLGPASDGLGFIVTMCIGRAAVGIKASVLRQGDWEPGDPWSPVMERQAGLPAGVPEVYAKAEVMTSYPVGGWIDGDLTVGIGVSSTKNEGHTESGMKWGPTVRVGVRGGAGNRAVVSPGKTPTNPVKASDISCSLGLSSVSNIAVPSIEVVKSMGNGGKGIVANGNIVFESNRLTGRGRVGVDLPVLGVPSRLLFGIFGYGDSANKEDFRVEFVGGVTKILWVTPKVGLYASALAGASMSITDNLEEGPYKQPGAKPISPVTELEAGLKAVLGRTALNLSGSANAFPDMGWYTLPKGSINARISFGL